MKKIYVDCLSHYYRAALVENGVLTELIYQDREDELAVGDIYVGRVERILPSGIAFVNIGRDKPVFLQGSNVKNGCEIMIQIEKEAYNEKCAVSTEKISLNGKYAVVIYNDNRIGISKKITDSKKRDELKSLADKFLKNNYGIIMRTNCENADLLEIESEIVSLMSELDLLIEKAKYVKAPYLLKKETDIISKTIRDIITSDCDGVVVNADVNLDYDTEIYRGSSPIFNYFCIESQIEKLFYRKIWLKSGGYIVIDETEAMTVIDVNSGKAIGEKNYIRVNEEAAKEAARQIRLRNLSGMIIIDFINVDDGNDAIYKTLKKYLSMDRVKTHIVGMTKLGLMQITRQKKRRALSKYITAPCPVCNGVGYVKSIEFLAETIINEIADIFSSTIYNCVQVASSNAIINELKKTSDKIEKIFNKKIVLKTINTTKFDYYEINKSRI